MMNLRDDLPLFYLLFIGASFCVDQGRTFNKETHIKACRAEDKYFQCFNTSQCIYRNTVHDFEPQCDDNSDENEGPLNCTDDEIICTTANQCFARDLVDFKERCIQNYIFPCRPNEFTCRITKGCIPRWRVMNGAIDCSTTEVEDSSDEEEFLPSCMENEFMCPRSHRCIPREWVGDGVNDCPSGIDETEQFNECRSETEFKCKEIGRCIPRYRVMDGFNDCRNGSDELITLTCIPDKEIECEVNGRCIPRSWRFNNIIDCPNGSDETSLFMNETCTSDEFLCHNHKRCIPNTYLCDGINNCGDCSDEVESCAEPRFYRCPNDPAGTCIRWEYSCNSFDNCPNGSDDITSITGFKCQRDVNKYCVIPQYSLNDSISLCNDGSDLCYRNGSFQCATCLDGVTIIAPRQICDGVIDCPDLSDECLCGKVISRASKIVSTIICDNVCYGDFTSSCSFCNVGEVFCEEDNICINKTNVCDGHVECPLSMLDENINVCGKTSLEQSSFKENDFMCDELSEETKSTIKSLSNGWELLDIYLFVTSARKCDGIFECPRFEDECSPRANCKNRSSLCDEIPMSTIDSIIVNQFIDEEEPIRKCEGKYEYVVGRSICNGVKECASNLDEMFCPDRFECDAGTINWLYQGKRSVVSINSTQRCDLIVDCKDSSDELNCSDETHFYCDGEEPLFVSRDKVLNGVADCRDQSDECTDTYLVDNAISSREFLIKSNPLNILIWFMAFFALLGNAFVAIKTIKSLALSTWCQFLEHTTSLTIINYILIFNLSIADFLMGIVLFVIIAKAQIFSGQYCLRDYLWRTGTTCNAIGVLTVLSSETSVFTLVCISSYRLYSVYYPFASRSMKKGWLGLWIFLIWFASLIISILPLLPSLSNYMITKMWIDGNNRYFARDTITLDDLKYFGKRIVGLNGTNMIKYIPDDWYSLETFLASHFPNEAPIRRGYFGYYSASTVCIPRFYRFEGENVNVLTSFVITFNFLALLYIISVYIAIYHNIKVKGAVVTKSDQKEKQLKTMQRKITILIATDLCCWLPICIMTFISMSGVILPPIAYAVSAIVLLPINSSLNPIIYSNAIPFAWKKFKEWVTAKSINFRMRLKSSDVSGTTLEKRIITTIL